MSAPPEVVVAEHSAGSAGLSSVGKLHKVGAVRSSTAAIIVVTCAQSLAPITSGDVPPVSLRSGLPTRSAHDASSASA